MKSKIKALELFLSKRGFGSELLLLKLSQEQSDTIIINSYGFEEKTFEEFCNAKLNEGSDCDSFLDYIKSYNEEFSEVFPRKTSDKCGLFFAKVDSGYNSLFIVPTTTVEGYGESKTTHEGFSKEDSSEFAADENFSYGSELENFIRTGYIPVNGKVTSQFDPNRYHPVHKDIRPHNGVDIAAAEGTPVYAMHDGTVYYSDYDSANGNMVKISHVGSEDGAIQTFYLHLNEAMVSAQDQVKKEQQIGTVGKTGTATGPHLHLEIHTSSGAQKFNYRDIGGSK